MDLRILTPTNSIILNINRNNATLTTNIPRKLELSPINGPTEVKPVISPCKQGEPPPNQLAELPSQRPKEDKRTPMSLSEYNICRLSDAMANTGKNSPKNTVKKTPPKKTKEQFIQIDPLLGDVTRVLTLLKICYPQLDNVSEDDLNIEIDAFLKYITRKR